MQDPKPRLAEPGPGNAYRGCHVDPPGQCGSSPRTTRSATEYAFIPRFSEDPSSFLEKIRRWAGRDRAPRAQRPCHYRCLIETIDMLVHEILSRISSRTQPQQKHRHDYW